LTVRVYDVPENPPRRRGLSTGRVHQLGHRTPERPVGTRPGGFPGSRYSVEPDARRTSATCWTGAEAPPTGTDPHDREDSAPSSCAVGPRWSSPCDSPPDRSYRAPGPCGPSAVGRSSVPTPIARCDRCRGWHGWHRLAGRRYGPYCRLSLDRFAIPVLPPPGSHAETRPRFRFGGSWSPHRARPANCPRVSTNACLATGASPGLVGRTPGATAPALVGPTAWYPGRTGCFRRATIARARQPGGPNSTRAGAHCSGTDGQARLASGWGPDDHRPVAGPVAGPRLPDDGGTERTPPVPSLRSPPPAGWRSGRHRLVPGTGMSRVRNTHQSALPGSAWSAMTPNWPTPSSPTGSAPARRTGSKEPDPVGGWTWLRGGHRRRRAARIPTPRSADRVANPDPGRGRTRVARLRVVRRAGWSCASRRADLPVAGGPRVRVR